MRYLEEYYNKFCEDKRLKHGYSQVEFLTTMHYIHKYSKPNMKLLDVGAGTGAYAVPLSEEGYRVDAIEYTKNNLGVLKAKKSKVKAYQGNAIDLSRYDSDKFDITLVFGPMYHLFGHDKKVKALEEAKRVTKPGGIIQVAYCMNDYSLIIHGFRDGNILKAIENGKVDENFITHNLEEDLFDYVSLEEIARINRDANLQRVEIVAVDGPANYMRSSFNQMESEVFKTFMDYHLKTCTRPDMLGMSAHILDVLRKPG